MMTQRRPTSSKTKTDFLLTLDRKSTLSLQNQIRRQIIAAISAGVFPRGWRLPSTRRLADELGVSRNTVSLAYEELVAEGHLRSSARSGIFVSDTASSTRIDRGRLVSGAQEGPESTAFIPRIKSVDMIEAGFRCPPDWQHFQFPFIDGRFDRSLFPIAEWREVSRLALAAGEVEQWARDSGELDDEMPIEQMRADFLPRRGIYAARNEVLMIGNQQQALNLVAELLIDRGDAVAIEEPSLPESRAIFKLKGAKLNYQPMDDEGITLGDELAKCSLVHITPSRQRPTGVSMPLERRQELLELAETQDFIVIEDDFDHEVDFVAKPVPALRGMPGGERVIYMGSFSRALAPGIQLAFLCGPASFIRAARELRDLTTNRPSPNIQRAAAHFLALGHYEAMNVRLSKVFEKRLMALRDALNHYLPKSIADPLPQSIEIAPISGGSTVWVRGPDGLDARHLAVELAGRSVLIEPASDYYGQDNKPLNVFRMGITSLPTERIRQGIEIIAKTIREMMEDKDEVASSANRLTGQKLRKTLTGAVLRYRTVYGEPCTIDLLPDGTLVGQAGFANEDTDRGKWWIENDRWYRQWEVWAYGEVANFYVAVDGVQLYWLNDEGRQVDSAIMASGQIPKS